MTRLARFTALSIAIHAALVVAAARAPFTLFGHPPTSLRVTLGDTAGTARTAAAAARAPANAIDPLPSTDDAVPFASAAREPAAAGAPVTDTASQVQARLLSELARYFEYPSLARQRGWQGEVWLAVRVETDGQLRAPRVARSSGFAVLDQSALHSLARVPRLAEVEAWHVSTALDLRVPVIYRLEE
jgi:protein TonB